MASLSSRQLIKISIGGWALGRVRIPLGCIDSGFAVAGRNGSGHLPRQSSIENPWPIRLVYLSIRENC